MTINPVALPSATQSALEAKRKLPRCLVEGTEAMRAAGKAYLPQNPAESLDAWRFRKDNTVLLPAYRDAIDLTCGLIFRKEVEEGDGVPAFAEEWLNDVDMCGRNVTQFAESVLRDAFDGVSYIVTDCPSTTAIEAQLGRKLTKTDEADHGIRPYLTHVKARQVLDWRTQRVNGRNVITQFRYMECTTEPDGEFGSKDVERIRVLEPGMLRVYVQTEDKKDWVLDAAASGPVTLQEVPVRPVYTGRTGFMVGVPPLLDLAHKNAQHWRCDSDLQNFIHKTTCPLFARIGAQDSGPNADVVIGPNNMIDLPMGGDAKWIELTGQSIPTAQANIETLKTEMQAMAGKLLDKGVVKTATQAGIESTQAMCRIQAWALGLQAGLNAAWSLCGKWIGEDLGTLAVNSDIDTSKIDPQRLAAYQADVVAGRMTLKTYLQILVLAEEMPEGFDIEDEISRLEAEGPVAMAPVPLPQ